MLLLILPALCATKLEAEASKIKIILHDKLLYTTGTCNVSFFTLLCRNFFQQPHTYQDRQKEPRHQVYLRHSSVPTKTLPFLNFLRIPKPLSVECRNSTSRFALLPERGNENIKYFISSSGNRTHPGAVLSYVCTSTT